MKYPLHLKHPLALLTSCLVLGALSTYLILGIVSAILFTLVLSKQLGSRAAWISVGGLALGCGSMWVQRQQYHEQQQSVITSQYVQVQVNEVKHYASVSIVKTTLIGTWQPNQWHLTTSFFLQITVKGSFTVSVGDILLVKTGLFDIPQKAKYTFEFNPVQFHFGEKRLGNLTVSSRNIYGLGHAHNRYYYVTRFKSLLEQKVRAYMTPTAWVWYQGLILGDKSGISKLDKYRFQQAGLMHILSVSGMHLGLIYWLLSWPLKRLIKRWKQSEIFELVLLPPLWFYACITGLAPPVFRAAVFISAFLWLKVSTKRRVRLADLLLSAVSLQVLFDPLVLYSISYQLSIAAMFGIGFVFPHWQDWWQTKVKRYHYWGDLLGMSLSCTLATLPLTLYYFHQIPTWFLLGNLVFTAPFTLLIYGYVGFSILVFTPFEVLSRGLAFCLNTAVAWLQMALQLLQELPLSFFFAYDFGVLDACIMILLILGSWRIYQQKQWAIYSLYIRIIVLIWMIFGYARVDFNTFSGEMDSRIAERPEQFQAAARWCQSQNIDTLYLMAEKHKQPLK